MSKKYLEKCIDSVISQTLKQIEIICVNDCSKDNSKKIINEYVKNDERIVVIEHRVNKGLSVARNNGIEASKGEYIFLLDSDDFLACDNALEILYVSAVKDNSDETIGGILKWIEDIDYKYLDWHKNYLTKEIHAQTLLSFPKLSSNVIAVNKLIKKSFINQRNIRFNENIKKNEDNPFSCKVHVMAKRITIIPKTTYIYRQQENGTLMTTTKKTDALDRCKYCLDIFNFIEKDKRRHIHRKIYYPMYSMQVLCAAGVLDNFSPTVEEKISIISYWQKIVYLLPKNLPAIPKIQKTIFKNIRKKKFDLAWNLAINLSKKESNIYNYKKKREIICIENIIEDLLEQYKMNEMLKGKIEEVYKSFSWRITSPLRNMVKKLRDYL